MFHLHHPDITTALESCPPGEAASGDAAHLLELEDAFSRPGVARLSAGTGLRVRRVTEAAAAAAEARAAAARARAEAIEADFPEAAGRQARAVRDMAEYARTRKNLLLGGGGGGGGSAAERKKE